MSSTNQVDDKTYSDRIEICRTCPDRKGRLMFASRCGLCGCPVATKAAIPAWHCPAKKW